jgi:hypothetical protein
VVLVFKEGRKRRRGEGEKGRSAGDVGSRVSPSPFLPLSLSAFLAAIHPI